jgi:hypothetical protein
VAAYFALQGLATKIANPLILQASTKLAKMPQMPKLSL